MAVVPPFAAALITVPVMTGPAESSMKCTLSSGAGPLKSAAGRKRTRALTERPTAADGAAAARSTQELPTTYCHFPWAAVAAVAVTTTPAKLLAAEPSGTWSVASEKRPANRLLTEAPGGSAASSATAGTATPTGPPVTVGASLTGVTISRVPTVPA